MDDNEVNKIIAEFMGHRIFQVTPDVYYIANKKGHCCSRTYTDSLDALVPVWEKLNVGDVKCYRYNKHPCEFSLSVMTSPIYGKAISGSTIQQAAAHATAKAIQELNTNNSIKDNNTN